MYWIQASRYHLESRPRGYTVAKVHMGRRTIYEAWRIADPDAGVPALRIGRADTADNAKWLAEQHHRENVHAAA